MLVARFPTIIRINECMMEHLGQPPMADGPLLQAPPVQRRVGQPAGSGGRSGLFSLRCSRRPEPSAAAERGLNSETFILR